METAGLRRLMEPAVDGLEAALSAVLPEGEEPLIRVCADLDAAGNYGSQWVVVTEKRIVVLPEGKADDAVSVPMAHVTSARTEALVGGARLEIELRNAPTVCIPYSNTRAARFSEAARGIEQLRKGEPFPVFSELDRTRCERCGRLLPEKNGICPACIHRLATLGRIAGYLRPYRGRALLLALASVVMTFSELISPLVTRRIVDDVLAPKGGAEAGMDQRLKLLGPRVAEGRPGKPNIQGHPVAALPARAVHAAEVL